MSVQILLATYNGMHFLESQLDSILRQTYSDWYILARDDGSIDGTVQLLDHFAVCYPNRIKVIQDHEKGLGARGNFARLLEHASAPYVMFCDQDDVWKPYKIEMLIEKMLQLETFMESSTPILVHSDLEVVDKDLNTIAKSFWRYQYIRPESNQGWNTLLVQNTVTGCATLINRALYQKALPIPVEAIMHDWWLALVAAVFGHLEALPQPTVCYRQHMTNDTGAKAWGWRTIVRKAVEARRSIEKTQRQARAFSERFGDLTPRAITQYGRLNEMGVLSKRAFLLRNRIAFTGWIRNLGFLLSV